jgi:NAD(P)-dependent dehydrogenase (short-subunit alcohol dehydrogenase family)
MPATVRHRNAQAATILKTLSPVTHATKLGASLRGYLVVERLQRMLVTGASYGLGATVAAAIHRRGDGVVTLSRTPPADRRISWIECDLEKTYSLEGVAVAIRNSDSEPFDGIVMNAALADKSQSQWSVHQVERHFRINALAPFALWAALEAQGLIAPVCNVVLMGSFLQNGNTRQPAYAMSKAALWSWMRSYTMNQPGDSGVSMNMIWPGRVATPANPPRELPPGDPNAFYSTARMSEVVLTYLYQEPNGPRGTVVDMGRS